MIVLFYGSVRERAGCQSIEIKQAETLRALIDNLVECLGEGFKEYLMSDDTCFFLVNGKSIISTGGLDTPLKPGDKIEILPIVEAG